VDVVTQENTKTNMEKMIPNSTAQDQTPPAQTIFQAHGGRGLPTKTFKDRMTMGEGADRIDLYYFGRGHTNGDAWVFFPSLRVVHAADIFSGKNVPILDANNGGSAVAIPDTLQKAYDTLTDAETIVTGHSTLMTRADLLEYARFNRDFLDAVRAAKEAGRTVDDVASTWKIPAKYVGYAEPQPARLRNNVALAYQEVNATISR
jgi:glyoxylase-like metal-dependent hydrolase (beta-lactamase superfamily II)